MKLWPVESNQDDIGGFIVEFSNNLRKQVVWRTGAPILPALEAAKQYAAALAEGMIADRMMPEVNATNWVSTVAAIQKIILDWNDKLTQRLYANDLANRMPTHGSPLQ